MLPYKYVALSANDFTRVLVLHPSADFNSPLRCDIHNCTEAEFSSCEALSYTWGAPVFSHRLLCNSNDKGLSITPSLDAALRALRHPLKTRVLWADAVCINQSDNKEKASQVRRMGEIFAKAREVIAWVGNDYDGGSDVIRFIRRFADKLQDVSQYIIERKGFNRDPQDLVGVKAIATIEYEIMNTLGPAAFRCVRQFFLRPWFQRRWIIQEVVLSHKAVICCGRESMEFHSFAMGAEALNLFCDPRSENMLDPDFLMEDNTAEMFTGISAKQRERQARGDRAGEPRYPIRALLNTFHSAQCGDGRDRIYALLGLCDDLVATPLRGEKRIRHKQPRIELPIDYEASVEQLYSSFAFTVLMGRYRNKPGDLLSMAGAFQQPEGSTSSLPSWIPDWRVRKRYWPISEGRFSLRLKPEDGRPWSPSADYRSIFLTGWIYSTLTVKADEALNLSTFEGIQQSLRRWWGFYDNASERRVQSPNADLDFADRLPWYDGFFSMIRAGRSGRESSSIYLEELANLILSPEPQHRTGRLETSGRNERRSFSTQSPAISRTGERNSESLLRLRSGIKSFALLMEGRGLFTDNRGRVLNCPATARPGDVVFVLHESDISFVLRPSGNKYEEPMKFRLVGDCLVGGSVAGKGGPSNKVFDAATSTRIQLV